jgi:hypothetical protein
VVEGLGVDPVAVAVLVRRIPDRHGEAERADGDEGLGVLEAKVLVAHRLPLWVVPGRVSGAGAFFVGLGEAFGLTRITTQ